MLKIKEIRERKKLSQDQVVELTRIPKRSYVNYESGKTDVPFSKLQDIASALNVTISEISGEDSDHVLEGPGEYHSSPKDISIIRNDIKTLSDALYQPLKDINDGVFKILLDQQKVLHFIDGVDIDNFNAIGGELREFLKNKGV